MSRRAVHTVVGGICGAGAAAYIARDEEAPAFVLEALGGAVGGYHGGILPDVLEPALTPHHRGLAHSVLASSGGAAAIIKKGNMPLQTMRDRLREFERELEITTDPWQRLLLALAIVTGHFAIGYGVGLAAGYGSHLLLDGSTARSLPLLG